MDVAILYASVEGHTQKIAETIAKQIEEDGINATLVNVNQPGLFDLASVDAAILCAPIHIGRYPAAFVKYIQNWKSTLKTLRTALITISLAIMSKNKEEKVEAESFPEELFAATGWNADRLYNAGGALKYMEYGFFKRWIMRRIAKKEGGPVDVTRDHELTDWKELAEFVEGFVLEVDMVS